MAGRHRSLPRSRWGRGVGASLALLLGAVLLSSGLGTWSSWRQQAAAASGSFKAGSVSIGNGTWSIQLWSQQLVGSRTYVSTTTCTLPGALPEIRECRDVTSTYASEKLIPGDHLYIVRTVKVSGTGNNLKGNVIVDASGIYTNTSDPLSQRVTVAYKITRAVGAATTPADGKGTFAASTTGTGFGTYSVAMDISTPTTNSGARWNNTQQNLALVLGNVNVTFQQT